MIWIFTNWILVVVVNDCLSFLETCFWTGFSTYILRKFSLSCLKNEIIMTLIHKRLLQTGDKRVWTESPGPETGWCLMGWWWAIWFRRGCHCRTPTHPPPFLLLLHSSVSTSTLSQTPPSPPTPQISNNRLRLRPVKTLINLCSSLRPNKRLLQSLHWSHSPDLFYNILST